MSSALVIGCTGLVGGEVLKTLISSPAFPSVQTISRREPKTPSPKLNAVVDSDTATWATKLGTLKPSTVISALGTTRAQAGGIDQQWKIDHDLNIELAKAAKEAGAKTFVFVSSGATRTIFSKSLPYSKMKVGVEDTVMGLGFDHAIILRPTVILGQREGDRQIESVTQGLVRGLAKISQGLHDTLGQEAVVIARAAVQAARLAEEGKAPKNPWVLETSDIVKLGRTEWKEE